ncbi:unnamed protein product [Microthlaspi erraticum]|uniref:Uncharacterized protein n=1 Tax=Microthlaspi erraticum TaxID=1685480 RepID=A0A6D2IHW6_9BRAS|nr:unnamed protein product [Microthlaspi erraticum]
MYYMILHGRRLIELQKCRHLILAAQNQNPFFAFSNSYSSTSAAAAVTHGRKGQNFTVSYLVDSFGFTTKLAESISKKVTFEDKRNPDSVLKLLKSHGFTDSQISDIVTVYPQLLIADAEKSLAPKLKSLQSRGGATTTSELTEILTKAPKILGIKKDKALSVYYDFVKDVIEADKSLEYKKLCPSSLPQGNTHENKIRNILALRELGMPQKLLFSMLTSGSQLVCGKEKFAESLKKVVGMGFAPTSLKFVNALRLVYGFTDKTTEGKIEIYKRLGFSVEDVWTAFKKWPSILIYSEMKVTNSIEEFLALGFSRDELSTMVKRFPQCIGYSSESVKKKTEFLVKKMNWPLKAVVSIPQVLGYSMEKRIVPRCSVIKALMSQGLLGNGSELPPLSSVLTSSDEKFLNLYVRKHDGKQLIPELIFIFNRGRLSYNS